MWGIEFQTPAEEIYTQAFIKARATLRVFQTPTEKFTPEIYEVATGKDLSFKLQRRNLHQDFFNENQGQKLFQTPTEKFILMVEGIIAKFL
nr:hypothetical protein [uncultured Campylobacter sp.]